MKLKSLLIAGSLIGSAYAATDSTLLIFGETQVNNYKIEFYDADYETQLEAQYNAEQDYIPAKFTSGDIVLDSIGVRYKGNSSYNMSKNSEKKPYKIKFDEYIENQSYYGVKKLNFSNCVKDPSMMREVLAYSVARKYMPAPRTAYANLSIGNDLIGLYVQVEQVSKTMLSRHFASNDGNLYKAGDDGTSLAYKGDNSTDYSADLELKTNKTEDDWSRLASFLERLENLENTGYEAELATWADMDNIARNIAFLVVFSQWDSYISSGRNFYLYDDPTSGQFTMIPWDENEAFGSYQATGNWDAIDMDVSELATTNKPLYSRLMQSDSLKALYQTYVLDMIRGAASLDSIQAQTTAIKAAISTHVQNDANGLYTYNDFLTNITSDISAGRESLLGVESFIKERAEAIEIQLVDFTPSEITSITDVGNSDLRADYSNGILKISTSQSSKYMDISVYNNLGQQVAQHSFSEVQAGTSILSLKLPTSSQKYWIQIKTPNSSTKLSYTPQM